MRFVKLVLFAALMVGWWQLWHVRDSITSAYTDERAPLALELDGVNIAPLESDRPESPFALVAAGTDRAPTFLPIATQPVDEEATSVGITGGSVALSGSVQLTDGTPAAGVTVRIERFTSDGQATAETVSDVDGSWSANGLQGGRLRVRAFVPNQLASVESTVLVMSENGSAQVPLTLVAPDPGLRFSLVGPTDIAIGTAGTAAVVISREAVDGWGRLIQTPVPANVTTASISGARLLSADRVVSDAGGAVRYLIACDVEGSPVVAISTGQVRTMLALPRCVPAALAVEPEAEADLAEPVR